MPFEMILPAILSTLKGKVLLGLMALLSTFAVSEVIFGQLIASVPPTLAVIVSLIVLVRGQKQTLVAMDGKLDAFMDAKVAAAKSAGKEEERVEARARQGEAAMAVQAASPTPVIVQNSETNPANVKPV
jgi:hypothetical protein